VLVAAFSLLQMREMSARMQHLVELTNAKSSPIAPNIPFPWPRSDGPMGRLWKRI